MANKGCFVITDVSGYTEYLTGSELDHANDILQRLLDAQLKAVKRPFLLSGFRGDAIFLYVPETNSVQSQRFWRALEPFPRANQPSRISMMELVNGRSLS